MWRLRPTALVDERPQPGCCFRMKGGVSALSFHVCFCLAGLISQHESVSTICLQLPSERQRQENESEGWGYQSNTKCESKSERGKMEHRIYREKQLEEKEKNRQSEFSIVRYKKYTHKLILTTHLYTSLRNYFFF